MWLGHALRMDHHANPLHLHGCRQKAEGEGAVHVKHGGGR